MNSRESSRGRIGRVALVALGAVALQAACVVVPARRVYGYGGSGYSYYVDPRTARAECFHQARDVRGYDVFAARDVAVTGPETAHVRLRVRGPFAPYTLDCTYNARTGYAYVP